jgi:hypothetical protein
VCLVSCSVVFFHAAMSLADEWKPVFVQPDRVVLKTDFSQPPPLTKEEWAARQGTCWSIEDGNLKPRPVKWKDRILLP